MSSESAEHKEMINEIIDYIGDTLEKPHTILSGLTDDLEHPDRPPEIGAGETSRGRVPDVYAINDKAIYIGEAKTPNDINQEHTLLQLEAYIGHIEHNVEFLGVYTFGKIILHTNIAHIQEFKKLIKKNYKNDKDYFIYLDDVR